ncbi:MAG TPA: hypothetical protein VH682_12255 [Gemmataceae bacterium]
MRRPSFALFIVLLGGSCPAAEEPRALIERAVKAMGGAEALQQKLAVCKKVKMKYYREGAGQAFTGEGELWQSGSRSKLSLLRSYPEGNKFMVTVVVTDSESWVAAHGQVRDLPKDEMRERGMSKHVDRVTGLTVLLRDKKYLLTPLADVQVNGQPAAGVKVSHKDQADMSLYFDKKTGLLVKYAFRTKRRGNNQEALYELILSDFREPDLASANEKLLRAAKRDTTGPALVAFLRQQTPSQAVLERVREQIGKLGDEVFGVRQQASRDLVAAGSAAIPLLRKASKSEDPEAARRARECLQQIGEQSGKDQIGAAVRLLALRRPKGAVEALWNYLPVADSDVADEVRAALFTLAHADGKPDPILVQALHDKDQGRRAAAAAVLGEDGGAYARQPGRRVIPHPFKTNNKTVRYVDGKLEGESEVSDYQFFNAFEDKLFAKP